MENHDKIVPFSSFEGMVASYERTNRRLWILCLILIIALIGTNAGWLYWESQWETVETTVTQDLDAGDGGNAVINDGVHINGESKTNGQN